jgi:4-amino-4-deoxy-L-arabinose transferase-like glycosyltransferase
MSEIVNTQNEQWFGRCFKYFVLLHIFAWTLVPSLVRFTLPLDAMEGTTWGRQFAWGYDKNPFLNAWLTELAITLGGKNGWLVYGFGTLCIAACFYSVWSIGKKILSPAYALLAVLFLETIQYYNLVATDFNDNVLEIGLWGLMALFFYKALTKNHFASWILLGITAGLAMMAKYYSAIMIISMLFLLIADKDSRKHFFNPALYWAFSCFLIIILPHTIWLVQHDFITINYAFHRVASPSSWTNHFYFPYLFSINVLQNLLPSLAFLCFLILGKPPYFLKTRHTILSFDKKFLLFVGLGPFILTLLLSFVFGMRLRAGWGAPLLTFIPLIFLALLQPKITLERIFRFFVLLALVLSTGLGYYAYSQITAGNTSSANFPGKQIATQLTREWKKRYHTPLFYVAGPRFLAGAVSLYSQDRPAVLIDWDPSVSFWIQDKMLRKKGGVFIRRIDQGQKTLPIKIQQQYPKLIKQKPHIFSWLRDPNASPIIVGVDFLPPNSS